MIKVKGISKSFSNKDILKDISFDISNGDSIAIIGQSGTGKSVLLKHLNGLLKPDSGNVYVNNVIINTFNELHRIGLSHSIECYEENKLIGGLYGVHIGSCFFGESMFSLKTNTSKFCLLYLLAILKKNSFTLLDSQFFNPHLIQFGAYEISSQSYEEKLKYGLQIKSNFYDINGFQESLSLIQSTNQRS